MHSAPSRIIPMYPEEGHSTSSATAGGGKRVKDRAMLILSQFSALVHGPCGDGAGGLALCEKALADWFSSSTCASRAVADLMWRAVVGSTGVPPVSCGQRSGYGPGRTGLRRLGQPA